MGYSKQDFEGTTSFLTGNELVLHDQSETAHPSLLALLKKHLEDELAKSAEIKDNKNKAGGYAGLDANGKIPYGLINTITTSLLGKGAVTREKLAAELIEELEGFVVKENGKGLSEVNYTKDRDEAVQKIAGILSDIYHLKQNSASSNALNKHVSDGTVHMTAAEREVFIKTAEGLVEECGNILQKVIEAQPSEDEPLTVNKGGTGASAPFMAMRHLGKTIYNCSQAKTNDISLTIDGFAVVYGCELRLFFRNGNQKANLNLTVNDRKYPVYSSLTGQPLTGEEIKEKQLCTFVLCEAYAGLPARWTLLNADADAVNKQYMTEYVEGVIGDFETIANSAYAEAYIKTASYTKTTTDDITKFEINGDISPTPHIIKVNIRVAGDVTVHVYGGGAKLYTETISGTAGDYNFEFNSNGAHGYILFNFVGAGASDYVIYLNVTYKQDASVVRDAINGDIEMLKTATEHIETNLGGRLTDTENRVAENQEAIADLIDGQNELEQSVGNIPNIINAKEHGLIADSEEEATKNNNDKIMADLLKTAAEQKNKIIYFPNGKYYFNSSFSVKSYTTIIGESKNGVSLIYPNAGMALSANTDYGDKLEYIHIENLTINSIDASGIYAEGIPISYSQFKNLSVSAGTLGLAFDCGGWLNSFEDIDITATTGFLYGNAYDDAGSTVHLKNVFCYSCYVGFDFYNLTYSNFDNVACDSTTSTAYQFKGCNININGLGCEGSGITQIINANNSTININNMFAYSNTSSSSFRVFVLNNSTVNVNGLKLDNEAKESAGALYSLSSYSHLNINDYISETTFNKKPISYDDGSTIHISGIDNYPVELKTFSMKPFVGTANMKKNKLNAMMSEEMHTGAIWFNNEGSPLKGLNGADHSLSKPRSAGDLFINNAPLDNGIAMWQQTAPEKIKFPYLQFTHIEEDTLCISDISLPDGEIYGINTLKPGMVLFSADNSYVSPVIDEVGGYDEEAGGYLVTFSDYPNITDLNYHIAEAGDLYVRIASRLGECEFAKVPIILADTSEELISKISNLPIGMQVFDTDLKTPLWVGINGDGNKALFDATGSMVAE